uniref:Uncharacterized protein n=1 Tax=Anguilla anguilla TaxID=7936 RepID=A0A0E9WE13_ANGAN
MATKPKNSQSGLLLPASGTSSSDAALLPFSPSVCNIFDVTEEVTLAQEMNK